MVIFAGQWWLGQVSGGGAWVVPGCLIRRFRGRFWIAGAEMTLGGERGPGGGGGGLGDVDLSLTA